MARCIRGLHKGSGAVAAYGVPTVIGSSPKIIIEVPSRVIHHVEAFSPELQVKAFLDREMAEKSRIQVGMPGTVDRNVPSRGPEAMLISVSAERHRRERGGIVPKLARSQTANLLERSYLVYGLVVTDLSQITIVGIQGCRVPSRVVPDPIELPAS